MKPIVVISGGSEGLGKAIARQLASKYQAVILSSSPEKLRQTALELGVDFFVCDLARREQVQSTVAAIIKKFQRIDVLINNAGLWIEGELDSNEPDFIQQVSEVNTLGTIFLTRAVVPLMKKQKEGIIINIISMAGLYTKVQRSVYGASKWAITGFTKSLQAELSPYGIKVTGIYPGLMNTNLFKKLNIKKDLTKALEPETVAKVIAFILSLDPQTEVLTVELKHLRY